MEILSGPQAVTNSGDATFQFTASDQGSGIDRILCRLNALPFSDCQNPKLFSNLASGSYTFFLKAIDRAGLESEIKTWNWIVDRTAPTLTVLSAPPPLTSLLEAMFLVRGNDNLGGNVNLFCSFDNSNFQSCINPIVQMMTPGSHSFKIYGVDALGNQSETLTHNWVIDNQAPLVNFIQKPPTPTNQNTFSFEVSAVDTPAGIQWFKCTYLKPSDGAGPGTVLNPCPTQFEFVNSENGYHQVKIQAADLAGNVSSVKSYFWLVDTTSPDITWLTPPPTTLNQEQSVVVEFSVLDTGSGLLDVKCYIDQQTPQICTSPWTSPVLTVGSHTLSIWARDRAGNQKILTAPIEVAPSPPPLDRFMYFGYYWAHSPYYGEYMHEVAPYTNFISLGPWISEAKILSDVQMAKDKGLKVIFDVSHCLFSHTGTYYRIKTPAERSAVWNTQLCKPLLQKLESEGNLFALYLLDEAYSYLYSYYAYDVKIRDPDGEFDSELIFSYVKNDIESVTAFLKNELPEVNVMATMASGRFVNQGEHDATATPYPPPNNIDIYSLSCYTDYTPVDHFERCESQYQSVAAQAQNSKMKILMTIESFVWATYPVNPTVEQQSHWMAIAKRIPKNIGVYWFLYPGTGGESGVNAGTRDFPHIVNYHRQTALQTLCQNQFENRPVCGANNQTYLNADLAKCASQNIVHLGPCH
ncbi:MAG: hypothetical protein IT289_04305 [Oligoflexia bacterium]|nr:hypothetical protein [Oligoflexia bacterium]